MTPNVEDEAGNVQGIGVVPLSSAIFEEDHDAHGVERFENVPREAFISSSCSVSISFLSFSLVQVSPSP